MNDFDKLFYDLEKLFLKNVDTFIKNNNNFNHLFNFNSFSPKVKVHEKNNRVYVNLEAPGLSKEHQVRINLHNDNLIVQGNLSRENELKSTRGNTTRETYNEFFYKTISLPVRVTSQGAKAVYENGSLKISLNKIGGLEEIDNEINLEFR